MLSEGFITSIRAQPKSADTGIVKDVGVYVHTIQPSPSIKATFKKSSTDPNCLAVSSTHIFAAQIDKAVVHIYSRDRGNQESLVSFPERIHSLVLVDDGVLVLGTAEGRLIIWEICTGRQVITPAAHLQRVGCISASRYHIVTGSDDSNIHVWSVPRLLSLASTDLHEPLRSLSNHHAAITSIQVGHSTSTNICVSASRDNTVIVWDYSTESILRTFLLPSTPLCLSLDPCDRAVFVGFEDGSLQVIDFLQSNAVNNALYDPNVQNTPLQISLPPWDPPSNLGPALCLSITYDGTTILSGHESGKLVQWDVGRRAFSSEITDLNAAITNISMLSPLPKARKSKTITAVKPKVAEGNYAFSTQLTGNLSPGPIDEALETTGFSLDMLEHAISSLSGSAKWSSSEDQTLRQENDDLWKLVHEQRILQKQTWEKYSMLKTGGT